MKLNLKKNELDYFFIKNSFKKIFVITGKNSYFRSTADKIFNKHLNEKNSFFYFKKNFVPEFNELKN